MRKRMGVSPGQKSGHNNEVTVRRGSMLYRHTMHALSMNYC